VAGNPTSEATSDDLTPAEALFLLDGAQADGQLALKVTLLDLMADGLLLLPPEGPPASTPHIVAARHTPTTANPYLLSPATSGGVPERLRHRAALVRVLSLGGPLGTAVPFRRAAPLLRSEFGADGSGFAAEHLPPDLAARGLMAREEGKRRLFGAAPPRWAWTPAGEAARAVWAERREAARLLAHDLHGAADAAARREDLDGVYLLAERAGAAVLIATGGGASFAPPDFRLMRRALLERGGLPAAARLPRLLAVAEHHGRRLDRALALLAGGVEQITPRSTPY
jgi:hypothetical protein